jgi:hypothetical protein
VRPEAGPAPVAIPYRSFALVDVLGFGGNEGEEYPRQIGFELGQIEKRAKKLKDSMTGKTAKTAARGG